MSCEAGALELGLVITTALLVDIGFGGIAGAGEGLVAATSAAGELRVMKSATAAVRKKTGIRRDMMFGNLAEKLKDARMR